MKFHSTIFAHFHCSSSSLGSISAISRVRSLMSAGSFSRTAAGNRAYFILRNEILTFCSKTVLATCGSKLRIKFSTVASPPAHFQQMSKGSGGGEGGLAPNYQPLCSIFLTSSQRYPCSLIVLTKTSSPPRFLPIDMKILDFLWVNLGIH